MTLDRVVMAFAGVVVIASVAFAQFVHPAWTWLTVFAGANMLQASFTGFCPGALLFKLLGVKSGSAFK